MKNKVDESNVVSRQELGAITNFLKNIFKLKNPDELINNAEKSNLNKTLGAFDLIVLGVGAIIGSGIFTVVGIATVGGPESVGAGPALIVSMVLASIACIFSALCYSEFAAMIPVAGSAYVYTFATMGEMMAFVIGWVLMLEYLLGYIAVASAWTGYLFQFLKGFEAYLPAFITNQEVWVFEAGKLFGTLPVTINIPAILATIIFGLILVKGTRESTRAAALMVVIKIAVILMFVITGAFFIKPENWTPFAPNGFEGIFMGAFIIFFAYIGFDAIATAAEETKNPQKNLPIGIIGSLLACTVVYVLVGLVLTGVVPLAEIDIQAPVAHAMRYIGQDWVAGFISIGALTGLTSVLLVLMLAGTRILFAMSRDKLLPAPLKIVHPKFQTPYVVTILFVILAVLGSFFLNINVAAELCNFGTLTCFMIVCLAVLILRKIDPKRPRPFKVPLVPFFPLAGIICCGGLMVYSMKSLTTSSALFPVWLVVGAIIYFAYGYRKNKIEEQEK